MESYISSEKQLIFNQYFMLNFGEQLIGSGENMQRYAGLLLK